MFSFLPVTFSVISLQYGTLSYGNLCALVMAYCFHLHNMMDYLLLMCAEKKGSGLSRFSQLVSNPSFQSHFCFEFPKCGSYIFLGYKGIWFINPPHYLGKQRIQTEEGLPTPQSDIMELGMLLRNQKVFQDLVEFWGVFIRLFVAVVLYTSGELVQ